MRPATRLALLLRITGSQAIVRRYFVVNGFDGALPCSGCCSASTSPARRRSPPSSTPASAPPWRSR